MFGYSICEMSVDWEVQFGESLSESSSESCSESSEASFCSASDLQSYDDSAEPIATEEEATQYAEQIAVEEEEEDMLLSRFAGETDLPDWYFIFCLFSDSFCSYQCINFCKKS